MIKFDELTGETVPMEGMILAQKITIVLFAVPATVFLLMMWLLSVIILYAFLIPSKIRKYLASKLPDSEENVSYTASKELLEDTIRKRKDASTVEAQYAEYEIYRKERARREQRVQQERATGRSD